MGEVDDAPAARRIALVLGERPMWWSLEKDAGTKNAGQSGQGCETGRTKAGVPTRTVPRITHVPRAWAVWGLALWSKRLSMRGDDEAHAKNLDKWQDGRLLRHLGGSCGLQARLLRYLDGPNQAAAKCNAHLWARLGPAVAP